MIKKTLFLAGGGLLVLGLLFGRNLIPYGQTMVTRAQNWAESQVDIRTKIDTARNQLRDVDQAIVDMTHDVAVQRVALSRLAREIEDRETALAEAQSHILRLRDHLASGESAFVSTSGRKFSNDRVREDLAGRFRRFKTNEEHLTTLRKTYEMRERGLDSTMQSLSETQIRKNELVAEVEALDAQAKNLEVARAASQYVRFDDSKLSRASKMIEEIRDRLEVEALMLNANPDSLGEIPMGESEAETDENIIDAVDAWFGAADDDSFASK